MAGSSTIEDQDRVTTHMVSSHFTTFRPRTVAVSLVAALVLVPLLSLATKALVEGATSLTYTIHWFETVPFIVLVFAFVLNGWLNERADRPDDPGA